MTNHLTPGKSTDRFFCPRLCLIFSGWSSNREASPNPRHSDTKQSFTGVTDGVELNECWDNTQYLSYFNRSSTCLVYTFKWLFRKVKCLLLNLFIEEDWTKQVDKEKLSKATYLKISQHRTSVSFCYTCLIYFLSEANVMPSKTAQIRSFHTRCW